MGHRQQLRCVRWEVSVLENVIYGVGGWLGGIATTFLLRWARKDHIMEGLTRMETALNLKKKMRDEGFSAEEINAVIHLVGSRSTTQIAQDDAEDDEDFSDMNEAATQGDMNLASFRRYERMDLEMRHELQRLEEVVSGVQLERLKRAQEGWEAYRKASGEMVDSRQGTIWPFIAAMITSKITKRRIEDLKGDRDVFREREGSA